MAISQLFHNFMTLIVPIKYFIKCSSICICLMFCFFRSPITSFCWSIVALGFLGGSVVKNPPANLGDAGLIPGSRRSLGEGNGTPLLYSFLPGKSHGQRGLVGHSPQGHKRVGMTQWLNNKGASQRRVSFCCPQKWTGCRLTCVLSLADFLCIQVSACFKQSPLCCTIGSH